MKAGSPEWIARRRQGITATDITVIAGLVSWDSPWALYHRKRGDLPEVEQSDRMRLGSWLEEHIISEWERQRFIEHGQGAREHLLYASEARPWQLATPDLAGLGWVLEVKATSQRDGWGDDGTDEIPPRVRAQVLWQMDTLDVPEGHVAVVFLPSGEFRSYSLRHAGRCDLIGLRTDGDRDPCDICPDIKQLRELGREFQGRIMDGDPPPVDGLTVTTDALKRRYPGGGASVPISRELVEGWEISGAIAREAKADHQRVVNEIRAVMGDSIEAVCDGDVMFRRVFSKVEGYTVDTYERDMIKRVKSDG